MQHRHFIGGTVQMILHMIYFYILYYNHDNCMCTHIYIYLCKHICPCTRVDFFVIELLSSLSPLCKPVEILMSILVLNKYFSS